VFWQTIRRLRGKNSNIARSINVQNGVHAEMRRHPGQMERVFQRPFELSHDHTIGHTGIHSKEENIITATEVFLSVTLKARKSEGCDEIRF